MTQTELAQRRLIEALAELNSTPGGLPGFRLGLAAGAIQSEAIDQPEQATFWRRLDDLAASVEADLKGASHG